MISVERFACNSKSVATDGVDNTRYLKKMYLDVDLF